MYGRERVLHDPPSVTPVLAEHGDDLLLTCVPADCQVHYRGKLSSVSTDVGQRSHQCVLPTCHPAPLQQRLPSLGPLLSLHHCPCTAAAGAPGGHVSLRIPTNSKSSCALLRYQSRTLRCTLVSSTFCTASTIPNSSALSFTTLLSNLSLSVWTVLHLFLRVCYSLNVDLMALIIARLQQPVTANLDVRASGWLQTSSSPAIPAGQCISNPHTVGPNSLFCQCADGYAGYACSMPYLNLR
jgi:hypothetical protein